MYTNIGLWYTLTQVNEDKVMYECLLLELEMEIEMYRKLRETKESGKTVFNYNIMEVFLTKKINKLKKEIEKYEKQRS